tara:strand:- start:3822 stop:4346 length:525 start_codon:yes stop_codon:yes gene_type:complete
MIKLKNIINEIGMFDAPEPGSKPVAPNADLEILMKYAKTLVNPLNNLVKLANKKGLTMGSKVKLSKSKDIAGYDQITIKPDWNTGKDYKASPDLFRDIKFVQTVQLIVLQYYPEIKTLECRGLDLSGRHLPGKKLGINSKFKIKDSKDLDSTLSKYTKELLKEISLFAKYINKK